VGQPPLPPPFASDLKYFRSFDGRVFAERVIAAEAPSHNFLPVHVYLFSCVCHSPSCSCRTANPGVSTSSGVILGGQGAKLWCCMNRFAPKADNLSCACWAAHNRAWHSLALYTWLLYEHTCSMHAYQSELITTRTNCIHLTAACALSRRWLLPRQAIWIPRKHGAVQQAAPKIRLLSRSALLVTSTCCAHALPSMLTCLAHLARAACSIVTVLSFQWCKAVTRA
jgi:hypothetical protein